MDLRSLIVRKSLSLAQGMIEPHAIGAMNYLVVITRRGSWDADTREYDEDAVVTVYDDDETPGIGAAAGVLATAGPMSTTFGDEPTDYDSVSVVIPRHRPGWPLNPRKDDIVQIMAGPDDDIIGRFFQVDSVPAGGRLLPSNRLECSGVAPDKRWTLG